MAATKLAELQADADASGTTGGLACRRQADPCARPARQIGDKKVMCWSGKVDLAPLKFPELDRVVLLKIYEALERILNWQAPLFREAHLNLDEPF